MYLLKRNDVNIEQLRQISKVLKYDFTKDFSLFPETKANDTSQSVSAMINGHQRLTTMVFSLTLAGYDYTFERLQELIKRWVRTLKSWI